MSVLPEPWWPTTLLAAALFGDAILSIRPPKFIRDCLDGVNLPREWWWVLICVKLLAVAGLLIGIKVEGVGLAANVGVIAYFLAATYAHVKARFLKQEFWLNCLGMLLFAVAVLLYSFVL
ncbi:DoxX family protein [Nocardioides sp. Root140]|uniref:DoxX family protein n=1 Tax=Nocardioides sp. Root140 TaxID=1736460 RepID=UPI0006FB4ECF|nr:DoxX family protein [Nocardioides sp. Root140]KQY57192.1 hypothetical protein ASD30_13190 [Nocardioides sp. Root140]